MRSSGESGRDRPRAVVAGHGDFAAGLISAVVAIGGEHGVFRGVSNAGLDPGALHTALRDAVAAHRAGVVFTDLPAGSCTLAARRVARERAGLAVVTGANVSMLLAFALESAAGESVAAHAAARGRDAIVVVLPPEGGGPEGGGAH